MNENKSCFIAGWSCHLTHLAARAGGRAFQKVSHFNLEDQQVDLYYYFQGSTRRKGILIEYIQFLALEWEEMSRFVKIRWLCLTRCCDKEQQKYPALQALLQVEQKVVFSKIGKTRRTMNQIITKITKKWFKRLKKPRS